MKKIILFILLSITVGFLSAQPTFKQYKKKGMEALKNENFTAAMQHYHDAWEIDEEDAETMYFYGESARQAYAYKEAEFAYESLLLTDEVANYPTAQYRLGEIQYQLGQYSSALRSLELYLSEYSGEDIALSKDAMRKQESIKWALDQSKDDYPQVKIEHLGNDVNSPYSEHAAVMNDGELYFTSLRYTKEKEEFDQDNHISKILKQDRKGIVNPIDRTRQFNNQNVLTSSTSFDIDKSVMFYSICDYTDQGQIHCDLYFSRLDVNGGLTQETKLPDFINGQLHTTTQPNVGPVVNGRTTLYFVSDRQGGSGGLDIWETSFDNYMKFSPPVNVKTLNTKGHDITPFYQANSQTIFLTTDYRNGMGGFDIYKSKVENQNYTIPENLGPRVNTSYNEIYYSQEGEEAYFSSNRPGSQYLIEKFETCCYDIYKAKYDECFIDLLALIYDANTKESLTGATITLTSKTSSSEPIILSNPEAHSYILDIECDEEYDIKVERDGYETAFITINAKDLDPINPQKQIYLIPIAQPAATNVDLHVNVYERATEYALQGATITLVDANTNETIDRVVNQEGNDFHFSIEENREYKIIASKDGYEQEILRAKANPGETSIMKNIYLGRIAKIATLAGLIPVSLYFDNDEPERRTMSLTTDKKYSTTFENYYQRKSKFVSVYSGYFSGRNQNQAYNEMEHFFDVEMQGGYDKLRIFLGTLVRVLDGGKRVNLYLRGYTSPISETEYNLALGKRRVESIKNEFSLYDGGILTKYMLSGQLVITERSFGESTSPIGVSDDPNVPSESIYSIEASKERRIEIDEIVEINN